MKLHRLIVGPLQSNAYLIADDNGDAAIVDPGGDAERIESAIQSHGLTPKYILCTHGHIDHVFAAGKLQQTFDVELLVHSQDRPMVEIIPGELAFIYDQRDSVKPRYGPPLTDKQIVKVGSLEVQVLHTPGHTPGGVCFLTGVDVLTGDTLFANGVGRTDLPGGSEQTLIWSIKNRLLTLDDDTRAHPGHGPGTTIGAERRSNPWLREA